MQQVHPPIGAMRSPALNHLYVVLDKETFAAIRDNRELAILLGRTDGGLPDYAPPKPDADRVFLRGRSTYLELFAPTNRFNEPVGKVGVALGHDEPVPFEALAKTWQGTCGTQMRRSRAEWTQAQPPVPWYDAVQCDDTAEGPNVAVWAMVYRPEFYRWQSQAAPNSPPRTARADVLEARLTAGQGRFDVTRVAIDVEPLLHAKLVAQLEKTGFSREDTAAGTRLLGQGWELLLRETNGAPGLVSIDLATDRPLRGEVSLGTARMVPRSAAGARLYFRTPVAD
ncbi:DUF5829 family protein [Sphingomonas mucosissima]|nr:DUF5829 family protein [Sphingomonas mucosissima]